MHLEKEKNNRKKNPWANRIPNGRDGGQQGVTAYESERMPKVTPVACKDCTKEVVAMRNCQLRIYNFEIYDKQCPREKQLAKEEKRQ